MFQFHLLRGKMKSEKFLTNVCWREIIRFLISSSVSGSNNEATNPQWLLITLRSKTLHRKSILTQNFFHLLGQKRRWILLMKILLSKRVGYKHSLKSKNYAFRLLNIKLCVMQLNSKAIGWLKSSQSKKRGEYLLDISLLCKRMLFQKEKKLRKTQNAISLFTATIFVSTKRVTIVAIFYTV